MALFAPKPVEERRYAGAAAPNHAARRDDSPIARAAASIGGTERGEDVNCKLCKSLAGTAHR
ncbi:hypothetical protein [Tahibacter caeni]|uniref:hypothetical protein n=1 Tax=Tahibacter caeni TaxID=1453545 RepID=UPI002147CAB5|nr:hypothetical protein [Tahibacter caeni]